MQLERRQVPQRDRCASVATAIMTGYRRYSRWRFLDDDTTLASPTVDPRVLAGHQQVTDLHLVNLAARHDAVLASFDAALLGWLTPTDRRHVELIPV